MKKINFRNDVLPLKDKLYRLSLRITLNTAEAEDVVQETLIRVWNNRDKWQDLNSVEAYSLTICRNLSIDRSQKKVNNQLTLNETYCDAPDNSFTPYEEIIHQDKISVIHKLFNQLPEKQRSVMQLRDIEGKSYREIAEILKISEEQVKVNLFRARQQIRQKYKEIENYGL